MFASGVSAWLDTPAAAAHVPGMGFVARRIRGAMLMLAGGVAAVSYAFSLTGPGGAKRADDEDPIDVQGLLASLTLVSMGAGVWRSPRRGGSDSAR